MANGSPELQPEDGKEEIIPINEFEEFQRQRLDILRYRVYERVNRIQDLSDDEEIEIVMRYLRRQNINPILLDLTR